jgi:mono/diheme cytochrome c family protein
MSSHLKWFVLGIFTTLVVLTVGAYLFIRTGGISMETTAPPLPLEKTVADMALRANLGQAAAQKNPVPFNDDTMLSAAQRYKQYCAVCHGTPGQPRTAISKGMFPDPPQLFEKEGMMTDDPEG